MERNEPNQIEKQRSWREDEGVQAWCLSGQDRWWIVYEVWGWGREGEEGYW
jgi:hypothetical protein